MKIKHMCFIIPNYPIKTDPVYTFVRELICSIADQGIKCTVIAPQSVTNIILKRKRKRPFYWEDYTENKNKIYIYQPYHAPFLNINLFKNKFSARLTEFVLKKTFKKININPDILYAHFWHSGVVASEIGEKNNIPVFVATGESEIWVNKLYSYEKINKAVKNINGVIAVSSKNKSESIRLNLADAEKIKVIPNSVNMKLFYPIKQEKARKYLNFKKEDFIICYVGAFSERKGILRLSEALKGVKDVKSIYIGTGELKPENPGILYEGRVPHNELLYYLNASDIFVLPTLAEGCSNAILEAMTCKLPIISSNLPFNDDILSEKNSIRINPKSVEDIRESIIYLKDNYEIRKRKSKCSLKLAEEFEINVRSQKIIEYIHNSGE